MSQGREDINACVEHLRLRLGASPDGTVVKNRQMAKHLLDAMAKEYPLSDPVVCVKRLIDIAHDNSFHCMLATNFLYIHRNRTRLILIGREQRAKKPQEQPASAVVGQIRKRD